MIPPVQVIGTRPAATVGTRNPRLAPTSKECCVSIYPVLVIVASDVCMFLSSDFTFLSVKFYCLRSLLMDAYDTDLSRP